MQCESGPKIDVEHVWTDGKSPPMSHLEWARGIAASIARKKGFVSNSQESDELEQVALLTLWRRALTFDTSRVPEGGDPHGLFRGWSHRSIASECDREARRLRAGGTFRTPNSKRANKVRVEALPTKISECGREEVALIDYRGADADDGPDTF